MSRGTGPKPPDIARLCVLALALAAGAGCSGEPTTAALAEDAPASAEELAALRKSSHGVADYRRKLKLKALESQGDLVIKPAPAKTKGKKQR